MPLKFSSLCKTIVAMKDGTVAKAKSASGSKAELWIDDTKLVMPIIRVNIVLITNAVIQAEPVSSEEYCFPEANFTNAADMTPNRN